MSRRRANHSTADLSAVATGPIPDHPLVVKEPANLVAEPDAFADLIDHLRSSGAFAYDTEFIGELSYFPQLCLVQVATAQRVAVIDALADLDLTPIWELLADASVRKVVHAGAQDLEPVVRHLGVPAANVWDTQVAAGFAGLPYPLSLTKLVAEAVDVKLGKGLTFTSWDERPLSPGHVRYAADDVRYLLAAADAIDGRLASTGHAAWAIEECDAACEPANFAFDPLIQARRIRSAKSLSPKQLAVLCELATVRNDGARERDMPPRSFVKDEVLVDIARNPPKHVEQLANVRGLPRPVITNYGQHLMEAIQRGHAVPRDQRPSLDYAPEESPTDRLRHDAAWAVASAYCLGQGIDPALVASRQEIAQLYHALAARTPATGGPIPRRLRSGWRQTLLDPFFRPFLQGDRQLTLQWSRQGLSAT